MRFVSAYYEEYYPFDQSGLFNSFITTQNPNDLRVGDVLCVWGGADITPRFYNKVRSPQSGASSHNPRDVIEWALMQKAKELKIPIIGICRGAQMLCALAGGYLIQHVVGHGGNHEVVTNEGERYVTNSLHHQMMVPGKTNHIIIAQIDPTQLRSRDAMGLPVYWDEDRKVDHPQEPEFIYFPDVQGFAVQWHPEMMRVSSRATQHVFEVLHQYINAEQTA